MLWMYSLRKYRTFTRQKIPAIADTSVLYLMTGDHVKILKPKQFIPDPFLSWSLRWLGHAFAHRCQQKNGSYIQVDVGHLFKALQ
jgi:hypothetical protein